MGRNTRQGGGCGLTFYTTRRQGASGNAYAFAGPINSHSSRDACASPIPPTDRAFAPIDVEGTGAAPGHSTLARVSSRVFGAEVGERDGLGETALRTMLADDVDDE